MLAVVNPTCMTCGGSCVARDFDGPCCLQCGRPAVPLPMPSPVLELRFDAELTATVRRERRFIDACVAAGKRAWA